MKDGIKRFGILFFFGIFVVFLIFSLIKGKLIVIEQYKDINYIVYTFFVLFSCYIVWYYGIKPTHIKFSRSILFVIGLSAIILGKTVLSNKGIEGVYFGDLASVFGVIILIIGPTGLIFTKKITKQKEENELEIIEI